MGRVQKQYPLGFGRSQFNSYFAAWKAQVSPSMRMEHKVGDKLYVDFAGKNYISLIKKPVRYKM